MYNNVLVAVLFIPINVYNQLIQFERKFSITSIVLTPAIGTYYLVLVGTLALFIPKLYAIISEPMEHLFTRSKAFSIVCFGCRILNTMVYEEKGERLWRILEPNTPLTVILDEIEQREVLLTPMLCEEFEKLCKSEKSEENIECWKEIEKYKQLQSTENKEEQFRLIVTKYVSNPEILNIDPKQRQKLVACLNAMSDSNAQVVPIDLKGLQNELEVNLNDTFQRLRLMPSFKEAVCKVVYKK